MTKKDNPVREKIIKGMELTHKRLIKFKKERNLDLIIYDKGRVVKISARDFETGS